MNRNKDQISEVDKFLCREFFSGKSFSVLARDYALQNHCSRGEAGEAVYDSIAEYVNDSDFNVVVLLSI